MTSQINLSQEIFSRFGAVKRARGCFLYTAKGVRLTDLYQENGKAILGWGGKNAFTVLKNVLDRGITGSFRTDFSVHQNGEKSQLSRAVSDLFGGARKLFVFRGKEKALKAALTLSKDSTSVFRPWNGSNVDWRNVDCVIFEPPLPWCDSIYLLCVKDGLEFDDSSFFGEDIPSPIAAAITRSIYNLIKALQEREEKNWFIYDKIITRYWERRGPYLYPKIPKELYNDFVLHCLEQGIIINPDYNSPSIVPFGADIGVFRGLEKNPYGAK